MVSARVAPWMGKRMGNQRVRRVLFLVTHTLAIAALGSNCGSDTQAGSVGTAPAHVTPASVPRAGKPASVPTCLS